MSKIRLASNAELTDPLIGNAIASGELEFGMAETVRPFRAICGYLR